MTLTESPPPAVVSSVAKPPHAPGDKEMTMMEHLEELRRRLVAMVLSVVLGIIFAIIPWPGFDSVTHFIIKVLGERAPIGKLVNTGPAEGFFTYLQVSMMVGIALAMPVIIYQILAFVSPALYDNEKKYLFIAVPGVTFSFACGVAFCYFLMLPFAINFLGGFANDVFQPLWTSEKYLNFVTSFMFWVGVTFELPIVMYFLSKMGVISAQRMAGFRKYAFVLAFVVGAIITPTPDPINQTIVSLPIYFLFELGVILARFA
jgi:sec-independent protein translocase protein TatC